MDQNTCYYCGKAPADPESAYHHRMLKGYDTEREKNIVNVGQVRMTARDTHYQTIEISRCTSCKALHQSSLRVQKNIAIGGTLLGAGLAFVLFRGHGVVWWMIGFAVLFFFLTTLPVGKSVDRRIILSRGVRLEGDVREHPDVIKYSNEGYH